MSRSALFASWLAAELLCGCYCPPTSPPSAPPRSALDSVVVVVTDTGPFGKHVGTGFVLSPQHVLTAYHVVSGLVFTITADARPCDVVWVSATMDVAVLWVPGLQRPPLRHVLREPEYGAPAAAFGALPVDGSIMFQTGFVQDRRDGLYYASTEVHPGCSGGPLMVVEDGEWRVAGVVVQMGLLPNGLPLTHVCRAVPIRAVLAAW